MGNIYDIGYGDNPPIEQGSTFQLPFTVSNVFAAGGVGCTIRGQLRTTYAATADVEFTATIQSTTVDVTTDGVTVPGILTCLASLTATATAGMAAGSYVYDIEIQDTAGFVLKPLRGKAKVIPEVTR